MDFFQIDVTKREEHGKGPVGRLRKRGMVPGVLYGLGRPNLDLTIPEGPLQKFLSDPSHLVELKMGDQARQAIVREVQIDPLTDVILHVDFNRVAADTEIEDHVRITWKGEAVGTTKGGVFQALEEALLIRSRPGDLPHEFIIDISGLELGDGIRGADVPMPKGVTLVTSGEALLCQVSAPKLDTSDEETGEAEGDAPAEGEAAAAATDE